MTSSIDASYAFCSKVARTQARNFYPSFLLLPKAQRLSMCALYAFLRHSDDIADEPAPLPQKQAALANWRNALKALKEPSSDSSNEWPGRLAFAHTVSRYEIPLAYLFDVLDGVEMDLVPQPFETFEQLQSYCYKVASVVGLCCLHIWGFRSEEHQAEELAVKTGYALQLTNILRDVREDAINGRIYLPSDELRRFGVDPTSLSGSMMTPPLRALFEFQAARAKGFYEEARRLQEFVEPSAGPVLQALTGIYERLLAEIVRHDYDVLSRRVAVPAWRKLAILSQALAGSLRRPTGLKPATRRAKTP